MSSNGTGNAANQPPTRTGLRPKRSDSGPAARLVRALVTPKATMKVSAAVTAVRWNTGVASSGRTVRSCPSMPPTSALTPTRRLNWAEGNCRDGQPRRPPSVDAALQLANEVFVSDLQALLDQISRVLARRPNDYQWPASRHDPPQPGGKCGAQRNR